MDLSLLKRVAALIVSERLLVICPILECLAEGKAQVISIDQWRGRRRLLSPHAHDLIVGEAVGLQVREAPVGVAEARSSRGGGSIGFDRLLLPPERLEYMSDRQVQVRLVRCVRQQVAKHPQRLVMVAETDAGGGVDGFKGAILRVDPQQFPHLLESLCMLVTL